MREPTLEEILHSQAWQDIKQAMLSDAVEDLSRVNPRDSAELQYHAHRVSAMRDIFSRLDAKIRARLRMPR